MDIHNFVDSPISRTTPVLEMAPNQSKPIGNASKKRERHPLAECAMNKIARGAAVFADDYVEAMAEGKKFPLPKNLDDVVVDVDDEDDDDDDKGIDWDAVLKPVPKEEIVKDEEVRTHAEAIQKAVCPKYSSRNPFKVFDDATWCSDGEEVKHFNIFCQGTESSPCSYCSDKDFKTPSPKKKKPDFAQAKGFRLEDYEGEEDTPRKMPAGVIACKWCKWAPCMLENDDVNEEARTIVDNLMAQEEQGIDLHFKNYRYALYRMYARALGYRGERVLLPVCVQAYVDKHFSNKDEERVGFKPK